MICKSIIFHIRVALIFNTRITYLDHHATSVATQKTMTTAAALKLVVQSYVMHFIMRLKLENKITRQWVMKSLWHHFVENQFRSFRCCAFYFLFCVEIYANLFAINKINLLFSTVSCRKLSYVSNERQDNLSLVNKINAF